MERVIKTVLRLRDRLQLENLLKRVIKLIFWVLLLMPVILVPLYYLLITLLR